MSPISLAYQPRRWQAECHSRFRRFNVLVLHRRAGKTELAIMQLLDLALKSTRELPFYAYVTPLLKQAKTIVWARLKQKVAPLVLTGAATIHEADLQVNFKHNGAVVRLFGADNPDALRGIRLDGLVVDEVAQVKPEVWTDVLQPALSDRLGWALFIGTPNGINLFSELYELGQSGDPDWWSIVYTVYDTDALDAAEVLRIRNDPLTSAASFSREYLCDFSAAGEDQLISVADVELAARRVYHERDVVNSPVILGVDPARFGNDKSVICRRQGLQCFNLQVWGGLDNMALAGRVCAMIEQHKPAATFIDSGAGAGVIDRCRQLGFDVIEVPFGGTALADARYVNRRSEMWTMMKDWLISGGAIPNDIDLKRELATPTYGYDASGTRIKLESKEEIKKRLPMRGSPDRADALALTFAAPVVGSVQRLTGIPDELVWPVRDYDPYDRKYHR